MAAADSAMPWEDCCEDGRQRTGELGSSGVLSRSMLQGAGTDGSHPLPGDVLKTREMIVLAERVVAD